MAWSTYILCAHGHGGEPLIRIIVGGERSEEKKNTSDVKCYPIKLEIHSSERWNLDTRVSVCEESQMFVYNMAQVAQQRLLVTAEGGQAGGQAWGNGRSRRPFPAPHPPPAGKEEEEGGGLRYFLCLPQATQQRQLSHSKDDITWQHYWPSDSNKKKKYFYYLTTDNDIQMCLTSQSESQSESRQLRLHVHHSRAG